MARQFFTDHPVKLGGDHPAVELLDINANFVGGMHQVDLPGRGVVVGDIFPRLPDNAVLRQGGNNTGGRLMVNQPAVNHRLWVAVGKDWVTKNLGGVEGGGGRQANLYRVEVVQHLPVLRHVVTKVSKGEFTIAQLPVKQVAPVALIHHNAVVLVGGEGFVAVAGVQQPLYKALYRTNVDLGVAVWGGILQLFDIKDIGKGLEALHAGVFEGIGGLLTQGAAIDQKQNAPKPFGLEQSIHQSNAGFGLAGAGGHGQQQLPLILHKGGFYRLNGANLVVAQLKIVGKGLSFEAIAGFLQVIRERIYQPRWAIPAANGPPQVFGSAQVAEPDAAFGL